MIDKHRIEFFTGGLDHPEGLAFDKEGILYAGGELGQIYRIGPEGNVKEICCTGGFSLGMSFGPDDHLYVCNEELGAVFKVRKDGSYELFANEVNGERMMTPNMAIFDKSGQLYVSDSGRWGESNGKIYRFAPDGTGELFSGGPYRFPNGISFNPDQSLLYVVESQRDFLLKIPILADGSAGKPETFGSDLDHILTASP